MPIVKYKKAEEEVLKKPVFTLKDFVDLGVPYGYAKKRLHILVKGKKVLRIERDKYTIYEDPLIVAPYLTEPSYISLWSAMRIRNLTDQIPFGVEVITSRRRYKTKIIFKGTPVFFHVVKPSMMYGYEYIPREDVRIPVARPEKIVIDAIYLKKIPIEELSDVLEASDKKLLMEYATLSRSKEVRKEVKKCLHNLN
ncbi:MAG: hypothetical protein J7K68_03550 [Candidatus Diapherotrites archaeon]|nr:hypothetical protein [Candidatus Diapherotrites archaeon]